VAPLTVTSPRDRVVDFTKPFWVDGFALLMKKRHAQQWAIGSVADLGHHQTPIRYGVVSGGSTEDFFRTARHPMFAGMWMEMERDQVENANFGAFSREFLEQYNISFSNRPLFIWSDAIVFFLYLGQCSVPLWFHCPVRCMRLP